MDASTKKSGGVKWWGLYGITGLIDAVQAMIGWTGVGTIVSEALEGVTPFIIIAYCQYILKVSVFTRVRRLASIFGLALFDGATGGIAPFWVMDVVYLQWDVKKEDAEVAAQQEEENLLSNITNRPLNEDGVRAPRIEISGAGTTSTSSSGGNSRIINMSARNVNGIRPPSKNPAPSAKRSVLR
jgi:hypothetical protein